MTLSQAVAGCWYYLREQGHHATSAQYFAQEMNWGNAAIGKINSVLHGLEATIAAGASTIADPAFKDGDGKVRKLSLVLANFPFSDDFWWLNSIYSVMLQNIRGPCRKG